MSYHINKVGLDYMCLFLFTRAKPYNCKEWKNDSTIKESVLKFDYKIQRSMKIVRVIYTTKPEFADQNQMNIQNVMTDLQKLNYPGINYTACLGPDGKTFTHTAFYNSEDDQKLLRELPSFRYFQEQLKTGGLEVPPKQELLTLVGSSTNLFSEL